MSLSFGMVRSKAGLSRQFAEEAKIVGLSGPYNNINYTPPILKDMILDPESWVEPSETQPTNYERSDKFIIFMQHIDIEEIKKEKSWLHWLESCSSTNSWATAHMANLKHGDVVFTRNQTAGRGQYGRTWFSPAGVLTASFVGDRIPISQLPGLSLAAGLAVVNAVESLLPEQQEKLYLKWPNDVLIARRKLAGILCEATSSSSSGYSRVVVGIGLNCCVDFAEVALDVNLVNKAVSLHQFCSFVPDELSLLERLRYYLMQVCEILTSSGLAGLLPELRRRDALLNCAIALELPEKKLFGQAVGIDEQGRLLLLSDGEVRAFSSGRVMFGE